MATLRDIGGHRGKPKAARFESLVDDHVAIFVPVEKLESVATLVAKDKEMA